MEEEHEEEEPKEEGEEEKSDEDESADTSGMLQNGGNVWLQPRENHQTPGLTLANS